MAFDTSYSNKQDQLALTTGCDKICSLVLGLCEAVRQGILFIVYACVDVLSKSYVINFKELCNPRTPPYQMGGVGGAHRESLFKTLEIPTWERVQ